MRAERLDHPEAAEPLRPVEIERSGPLATTAQGSGQCARKPALSEPMPAAGKNWGQPQ